MKLDDLAALAPQKTFLIQGNEEGFEAFLSSAMVANPLTSALSVGRFTTEHARNLVMFINEGNGSERLYVVFFAIFSPDAAQILLKSLEEPDTDTTVVLMTPYPYLVPITIRSRVMLMHTDAHREVLSHDRITASNAAMLSRENMLAHIKETFASDAEEDAATRRAKAVQLLDQFEAHVRNHPRKAAIVYQAKDMLFAGNLPTKYVLEYAASMVL